MQKTFLNSRSLLSVLAILSCQGLLATNPFSEEKQHFNNIYPSLNDTGKGLQLDESIVTSTKVKRSKNDLPGSITLLQGKALNQEQVLSVKDLNASLANVYIPDYGSSLSAPIYIRGIGSRRLPSIGVYYDGIPLQDGSAYDTDIFDLSTVEMLRGPQNMIFGRGAMGGILNFVSKRPLSYQGTDLLFRFGDYGLSNLGIGTSQILSKGMGLSTYLNYIHKGGYFTNTFNNKVIDKSNSVAFKMAWEWKTQNNWHLYSFLKYQYKTQGGYAYGKLLGDGTMGEINYNDESNYMRNLFLYGLYAEKKWKNGLTLRSATSYQYFDDRLNLDQDFTEKPMFYATQTNVKDIFTQELTLSRTKGRYSWASGIYGFFSKGPRNMNMLANITTPRGAMKMRSNLYYGEKDLGIAFFHQSSYYFTNKLSAEFGIRADLERIYQKNTATEIAMGRTNVIEKYDEGKTFKQITPKVSLLYHFNNLNKVYATVLKGYQPGGYNTFYDTNESPLYEAENSWNYELGTKLSFFNNKLTADAALFFIDWRNQQVSQPLATQKGVKITNAGKSQSYGGELTINYMPTKQTFFSLAYGYTHAKYQSYPYSEKDRTGAVIHSDFAGNYIQQVPQQTLSLLANYSIKLPRNPIAQNVEIGAQYKMLGKIYWNDNNTLSQNPYSTLNTQITLKGKNWDLDFWAKNVLNKDYNVYYFESLGTKLAAKGAPRHCGLTLHLHF